MCLFGDVDPPCNCGSKARASVVKHVVCSLIKAEIRLSLLAGSLTGKGPTRLLAHSSHFCV